MAKNYQILEHRADLKIRAFGKTKEEVFVNMLLAMEDYLQIELDPLSETLSRRVEIHSLDLETLLVDFLNEVNFYIETEKEFYGGMEFKKLTNTELKGELKGWKIKKIGRNIKAATYHSTEFSQLGDGTWQATVLFDI
jgi:SHS2 domain-containing protein